MSLRTCRPRRISVPLARLRIEPRRASRVPFSSDVSSRSGTCPSITTRHVHFSLPWPPPTRPDHATVSVVTRSLSRPSSIPKRLVSSTRPSVTTLSFYHADDCARRSHGITSVLRQLAWHTTWRVNLHSARIGRPPRELRLTRRPRAALSSNSLTPPAHRSRSAFICPSSAHSRIRPRTSAESALKVRRVFGAERHENTTSLRAIADRVESNFTVPGS